MVEIVNCFIDSNVIADWIIIKNTRASILIPEEENIFIKNLEKDNPRAFYSYSIIQNILLREFATPKFYTSHLAMSEVTSVIFEKLLMDEMFREKMPFKYWDWYKHKIKLPKEVLQLIAQEIIRFYLLFIVKRTSRKRRIYPCKEPIIQGTIELITKYSCRVQDAYLVCQAFSNKCKFFVTSDGRLSESLKEYSKVKIMTPQHFYNEILFTKK